MFDVSREIKQCAIVIPHEYLYNDDMMKKRLIMLAVVLPLLLLSCDENEMGGG